MMLYHRSTFATATTLNRIHTTLELTCNRCLNVTRFYSLTGTRTQKDAHSNLQPHRYTVRKDFLKMIFNQ